MHASHTRRSSRAILVVTVTLALLAAHCQSVQAAGAVALIRTYDSDTRGLVYEVCRGEFNPPPTDPINPAYCNGKAEYWSQQRWQAYVKNGEEGSAEAAHKQPKPKSPGAKNKPEVAVGPSPPSAEPAAQSAVPYGGSLDPTSVLDVTNPLCGERGELSAQQVSNCRSSGSPEAAYPPGNYGWDVHVSAGGFITSLFAPAVAFVLQLLSVFFWLFPLLILKGCLIVLGFAFSLSPFTSNPMLRQIGTGLDSFYANFTAPWLTTLMVVLGGWGLYNGIVRRRAGETVGGMLAALVMMLAAMWIIHSPRETVGSLAEIVNKASLVAVSAPSSGNLGTPVRSYDSAMSAVWDQMTAVPFCAMDFSNVHWCLDAKPSKQALEVARGGLSVDEPFAQTLLKDLPKDEAAATHVLNRRLEAVFGNASTIRDLYLRLSPGSGPREALWTYFAGKEDDHVGLPFDVGPQIDVGGGTSGAAPDKVSMQGRSGLLPRIVLVLVFALGLIGGLLLFLWLSLKLVMAAASAFVLVLMAPLAMFMPVFGAAGRAAFVRWFTSLLGAVLAKLIFSALLGVVLLGSRVLGSGIGGSSPTLGLIATMAMWWSVFLSRERYLALLQIDPVRDQGTSLYHAAAGGYVGYRIATAAKSAISRHRDEHQEQARQRHESQVRAGREAGEQELGAQAQQRLDVATSRAEGREGLRAKDQSEVGALREDPELQALRQDPSRLDPATTERAQRKAQRLRTLESGLEARRAESVADRQVLRRVRANEAAGLPRHGRDEIEGAKDAIRREAGLGAEAPDHRWRAEAVGKDPDSNAGRTAIGESLARAQSAVGATSSARLEQVDLHRLSRISGGRRRSSSNLGASQSQPAETPRPKRRSRSRSGLSR
jgi:hypothetical protein